jgi:predicted nucleic acid-binding protein
LVDCLRGTPPARAWLESASTEVLGIPGVVAMELLIGCRNRAEVEHLQKFLSAFSIVWPDAAEFARAYELLAEHRLTSGLGIPDCLIAAMSLAQSSVVHVQPQTLSSHSRDRRPRAVLSAVIVPGETAVARTVCERRTARNIAEQSASAARRNVTSRCAIFCGLNCRETVAELYLLTALGMQSERKQISQVVENIERRRHVIEPLEGQGVRPRRPVCRRHLPRREGRLGHAGGPRLPALAPSSHRSAWVDNAVRADAFKKASAIAPANRRQRTAPAVAPRS